MSFWDWGVLAFTLLSIPIYGIWRGRQSKGLDGFLRAGRSLPWYHVGLSVMATQASAITFIAGPGYGYGHGLGFIQFYLGLPLAVIILCVSFIPKYYQLNVYTAYEYLEGRFDLKTRLLTAFLFLGLRALSTAISIYAPAIILSSLLPIPSYISTLAVGVLVISYTLTGGSKAISYTQVLQMLIIFAGLITAAFVTINLLPPGVHFQQAWHIGGLLGHLKAIDFHFNLHERYTIWSGLIGGLFLQLSYFGTDQSQVGRYLTGSNSDESKLGLMLNGLIKIPMQLGILMIGVLVFVFYQFNEPPLVFNPVVRTQLLKGEQKRPFTQLQAQYHQRFMEKTKLLDGYLRSTPAEGPVALDQRRQQIQSLHENMLGLQKKASHLHTADATSGVNEDSNYVFLTFIIQYLPKGLVGALIAIIFISSMGAVSSALNAMASCSVVDFYKRILRTDGPESHYVSMSKFFTLLWGIICVGLALVAVHFGNLLEAVNAIGSLVYGSILGVFLVAFYLKWVQGHSVFMAALVSELVVLSLSWLHVMEYLWLNVVGSISVILFSLLWESTIFRQNKLNPVLNNQST